MSHLRRATILASALFLTPLATAQELASPRLPSNARTAIAAAPDQDAVWRAYDISDLTGQDRADELRHVLGLVKPADVEKSLTTFLAAQNAASATAKAIVETIRVHGLPAFEGKGAVRADVAGKLLVSGTPAHMAWVDAFLAIQRQADRQVQIVATLYSVPAGAVDKLGVERSSQQFPIGRLTKLIAGLEAMPDSHALFMPKVLVSSRQLATITSFEEIAYVKDYELLIVQPGDQEIADPVIAMVKHGIEFDLRAIHLGSSRYAIDVDLVRSDVTMPMATAKTTLGTHHDTLVTISMPEVRRVRLTTRMALGPDESLVIRTPDQDENLDYIMVLQLEESGPIPAKKGVKGQR